MDVSRTELKKIADEADASRKRERERRKKEERDTASRQHTEAEGAADKILASIPDALKGAAPDARRTSGKKGRVVIAKIPIVNERLHSIMDNAGCLDDEDELVLKAVRRKFKSLHIPGVEISLRTETHHHSYGSADGLDESKGPCTYYYIEARTQID